MYACVRVCACMCVCVCVRVHACVHMCMTGRDIGISERDMINTQVHTFYFWTNWEWTPAHTPPSRFGFCSPLLCTCEFQLPGTESRHASWWHVANSQLKLTYVRLWLVVCEMCLTPFTSSVTANDAGPRACGTQSYCLCWMSVAVTTTTTTTNNDGYLAQ